MKDIILFGIQGSGKGTQARLVLEKYPESFSYFSSGDVFRALMAKENAIGDFLQHRIQTGQLISDEITESLFHAYVHTVREDKKAMMLDGYPRSLHQGKDLLKVLEQYDRKPLIIFFDVPDDVVIERMLARGRADDTKESISNRISQFYDKTMPVVELFKQHADIVHINANDTIENIHENMIKAIEKYNA